MKRVCSVAFFVVVIVCIFEYFFSVNTVVFAQYPSITPPGGCDSGPNQGDECTQSSQCAGCLDIGAGSYTCQGYNPPSTCGICYCTSALPTVGASNCGPWGNCGYNNPPGVWCETRFCVILQRPEGSKPSGRSLKSY